MNRETLFGYIKKYFAMSDAEITKCVDTKKFERDYNRVRLTAVLEALVPSFDKYLTNNIVDDKLKRKVGAVILSRLDYSNFDDENPGQIRDRLSRLFYQTTRKGINPYKIVYCSVLTDACLKRDGDSGTKYFANDRDFDSIYNSLVDTLALSNAEAVAMFERCSTLIAKGSAYKFPHVRNKLMELSVSENYNTYWAFSRKNREVEEILKINPSLFVVSTDKIGSAFYYLQRKMYNVLQEEFKTVSQERPNMTFLDYRLFKTREWLKNNSSLLTINAQEMARKEKLFVSINTLTGGKYTNEFRDFFRSPLNLALINQIPYDKISRNAIKNIQLLEKYTTNDKVANYLKNNQLAVGMDYAKFGSLVEQIVTLDKQNSEKKYFDKFLEFGKTLFASNIDFSIEKTISKLQDDTVLIDVDVESMNDKQALTQFVDIFFDHNHSIEIELEKLIKEKNLRNVFGEKELRSKIRQTGRQVENLPKILKDDSTTIKHKRDYVLALIKNVGYLQTQRLALVETFSNNQSVQYVETKIGETIENTLNTLRDAYEQNKARLGKKYTNLDKLFDKTMGYLGVCLDDKEPVTQLFKRELVDNFVGAMEDTFEHHSDDQIRLFGKAPMVVTGVTHGLQKSLKELNEEINRNDLYEDETVIEFEKK